MSNWDEAVVIALGSNLPGRFDSCEALLEGALETLSDVGLRVIARSGWWRSAAWPDPADPPFFNGVALVETKLDAESTLALLHDIEDAFDRQRSAANAPRTLDLDLVAFGRRVSEGPEAATPHPRAHERLFVMGPLAQVAPDWRHPVLGKTAAALASEATVGADAQPLS
jgi:2-amino-4-hydroxy-6-hydroxymethyldihydropteridine diphosphokinase